MLKRIFDILVSSSMLILLLPINIFIAILIYSEDRKSILFKQKRIGLNQKPFILYKFRSMTITKTSSKESFDAGDISRVTKIGKILRKTKFDELPQLWNVLRGDMSLVGPRPILEIEISRYGSSLDLYLKVKPGITGLWQVSGRNNTSFEERVKFDEYYVRNWSVWMDLYVLGRTIKAVMRAEGAY